MSDLQRITTADIKKAIGKGWITNVREEDIMANPLLARMVEGKQTIELVPPRPAAIDKKAKGKGGPVIDLLLRCPRCRHEQHEYVYSSADKPWVKCDDCQQLSPSGAWTIVTLSSRGLPTTSS